MVTNLSFATHIKQVAKMKATSSLNISWCSHRIFDLDAWEGVKQFDLKFFVVFRCDFILTLHNIQNVHSFCPCMCYLLFVLFCFSSRGG